MSEWSMQGTRKEPNGASHLERIFIQTNAHSFIYSFNMLAAIQYLFDLCKLLLLLLIHSTLMEYSCLKYIYISILMGQLQVSTTVV